MSYYGNYTVMNGDLPEKLDQFKCDICGEILDESDERIIDHDKGKDYCVDCAFKAGIINDKEYVSMIYGYPCDRAATRNGKIYTVYGKHKFPWEKKFPSLEYDYYYKEFKKEVLERDNHTCQRCGKKNVNLVYHIESIKEHPEKCVDVDNGITLCKSCLMREANTK